MTLFLLKDVKKLLAYGHAYYVNKISSAVPITIYIAEDAYLLKFLIHTRCIEDILNPGMYVWTFKLN